MWEPRRVSLLQLLGLAAALLASAQAAVHRGGAAAQDAPLPPARAHCRVFVVASRTHTRVLALQNAYEQDNINVFDRSPPLLSVLRGVDAQDAQDEKTRAESAYEALRPALEQAAEWLTPRVDPALCYAHFVLADSELIGAGSSAQDAAKPKPAAAARVTRRLDQLRDRARSDGRFPFALNAPAAADADSVTPSGDLRVVTRAWLRYFSVVGTNYFSGRVAPSLSPGQVEVFGVLHVDAGGHEGTATSASDADAAEMVFDVRERWRRSKRQRQVNVALNTSDFYGREYPGFSRCQVRQAVVTLQQQQQRQNEQAETDAVQHPCFLTGQSAEVVGMNVTVQGAGDSDRCMALLKSHVSSSNANCPPQNFCFLGSAPQPQGFGSFYASGVLREAVITATRVLEYVGNKREENNLAQLQLPTPTLPALRDAAKSLCALPFKDVMAEQMGVEDVDERIHFVEHFEKQPILSRHGSKAGADRSSPPELVAWLTGAFLYLEALQRKVTFSIESELLAEQLSAGLPLGWNMSLMLLVAACAFLYLTTGRGVVTKRNGRGSSGYRRVVNGGAKAKYKDTTQSIRLNYFCTLTWMLNWLTSLTCSASNAASVCLPPLMLALETLTLVLRNSLLCIAVGRRVLDDVLNDVLDDLVTVPMVAGVPLLLLEYGVLRLDSELLRLSDNVEAKGCCWTKAAAAGRGAAAGELRGSRQKLMAMLVKQLRSFSTTPPVCHSISQNQLCLEMPIPDQHLASLRYCDKCTSNGCTNDACTISPAGTGVPNSDFVIYVRAENTENCKSSSTLAYASTCQQDQYDRPTFGMVNFCPLQISTADSAFERLVSAALHEFSHALGFSARFFPLMRDEKGNPRTPRDAQGNPPTYLEGTCPNNRKIDSYVEPADTTIKYSTERGHVVAKMVTPRVRAFVQDHFNCSTLEGAEIESQDEGCLGSHWEERIFEPEYMSPVDSYRNVFSALTLAFFADSGWYRVNASTSEVMHFGRKKGCAFATQKCIDPLTEVPVAADYFCTSRDYQGCSADATSRSVCSLSTKDQVIPEEYRYFSSNPGKGGENIFADYCPLNLGYEGGDCTISTNLPTGINAFGETYCPTCKCTSTSLRSLFQVQKENAQLKTNFAQLDGQWEAICEDLQVTADATAERYRFDFKRLMAEYETEARALRDQFAKMERQLKTAGLVADSLEARSLNMDPAMTFMNCHQTQVTGNWRRLEDFPSTTRSHGKHTAFLDLTGDPSSGDSSHEEPRATKAGRALKASAFIPSRPTQWGPTQQRARPAD
ncbi:leishmanolysin-like peptidase [Phytophthora cinnamomi]|uniref:leishmanolysin-like peptidase n=1 Tax=Phytophthora cinnamomi TaxID=4785 RepID=UPI00355977BA|nr:leishmanolysin-like peptidase [Phytophthora cinnamomi]